MQEKIKISSVIIAKNEEENIKRCIESQLNCIDEIIVLVDNSTIDKTYEIVKLYSGVITELVKWRGYSETKRYAVSLAKNNWILWIDADESITESLQKELIKFKESEPGYNAYSIPRKAYFLGKWIRHSGWYPGRVTRLFDKNSVKFSNDNNVHEYLIVNGETGKLNADLNHFTDPTLYHYFEKFNNYTTLAAEDLLYKGKKVNIFDIIFRPPFMFLKMYIFRLGFMDGIEGFMLAVFSSAYVFTKYCKFWERKIKNGGADKGT